MLERRKTPTPDEARAAIEKYGGQRAAGRALGIHHSFLCRLAKRPGESGTASASGAEKAPLLAEQGTEVKRGISVSSGIVLRGDTRVSEKRPQKKSLRWWFFDLPKGRAFRIADLASKWGFSRETIRRHAQDSECFAYIDLTGHDDWEECAMHPDTARNYLKGGAE